jgi:hypothetical protein
MPPASLPEITEVKRLTIRPGDRIVVRLGSDLYDDADIDEIKRRLADMFDGLPYVPPVIVLGPDIDLEVAGPEADGA